MPIATDASGTYGTEITNFQSYSNATIYKTILSRNSTKTIVYGLAALWRNTAAITSIQLVPYSGSNFASGSTFALYGVKAA